MFLLMFALGMAVVVIIVLLGVIICLCDFQQTKPKILPDFFKNNVHLKNYSDTDLKPNPKMVNLMNTFLELMRLHYLKDAVSFWNEREQSIKMTEVTFAKSEIQKQLEEIFKDDKNINIISPTPFTVGELSGWNSLNFIVSYSGTTFDYKNYLKLEDIGFKKRDDNTYEKTSTNGFNCQVKVCHLGKEGLEYKQKISDIVPKDEQILIMYGFHLLHLDYDYNHMDQLSKLVDIAYFTKFMEQKKD